VLDVFDVSPDAGLGVGIAGFLGGGRENEGVVWIGAWVAVVVVLLLGVRGTWAGG
jgi:hypothetical protein